MTSPLRTLLEQEHGIQQAKVIETGRCAHGYAAFALVQPGPPFDAQLRAIPLWHRGPRTSIRPRPTATTAAGEKLYPCEPVSDAL